MSSENMSGAVNPAFCGGTDLNSKLARKKDKTDLKFMEIPAVY